MTKQEFLDKLRVALSGRVSASLVQENVTYYMEYIDSQIRMGINEEEVMEMLGDPRLIARTIIQTNGTDTVEDAVYRESTAYDDNGETYGGYDNRSDYSDRTNEVKVRTIPGWLATIIGIVILIFILNIVFSVVSFLAPIVLPVLLVVFLVKLFRDWLN